MVLPNPNGMEFYDAFTTVQFLPAEGRALHTFLTPNGSKLLWPMDVNHPDNRQLLRAPPPA